MTNLFLYKPLSEYIVNAVPFSLILLATHPLLVLGLVMFCIGAGGLAGFGKASIPLMSLNAIGSNLWGHGPLHECCDYQSKTE